MNKKVKNQHSRLTWEKSTFLLIFIVAAVILVMLPFLTTFNELITKILEKIGIYVAIQNWVVPWESKMVGAVLLPLKISYIAHPNGMTVNGAFIELTWNCIGWQSLILLGVTFIVGLTGPYTWISRTESIIIGILGTFFVNLFRMTFTVVLGAYSGEVFALIFHDYFSTFVIIIWLFIYWWFCYRYVLEIKK